MSEIAAIPRINNPSHMADIVASSGDAIVAQTFEGVVTCWNQASERMLGWSANAILGQSFSLIVPAGRLNTERLTIGRIRAGVQVEHVQTERMHKDGRIIAVHATVSPIRAADGAIIGVSSMMRPMQPEMAEAAGQIATMHSGAHHGATVLLVEDDIALIDLLAETLRAEGLTVIAAADGREALDLLEMHPEVSAVVSDIVMPNGVNGVLLAREAQRMRPHLPVLLMSGGEPEEIGRLGDSTSFPFLVKPFRPGELTSRMRGMLN